MKYARRMSAGFVLVVALSLGLSLLSTASRSQTDSGPRSWASAPRHSAGIAPDPAQLADVAVVQVYAASTYGWRGVVAVHSWIIFKRAGETTFTRYDVVGWGGSDVIRRDYAIPDGLWFGARPALLVDHRGPAAQAMVGRIEAAIERYPHPHTYRAWPGPNSNTFVAHIGREVPELGLDLPANAIGKDYRPFTSPVGLSSSGKGLQLSLLGLLGFNMGIEEGVEINLFGMHFGVDLNSPGLRLPFVGRLGFDDTTRSGSAGAEAAGG